MEQFSLVNLVDWSPLHLLIPLLVAQRLWELRLASRHERALRKRGAIEFGAEHYPQIVTIHLLWFVGMVLEIFFLSRQINPYWPAFLLLFLLAQGLRYWTIRTLGDRWTTRVLVLPNTRPITSGPFRFLRHPNYTAVVVELLVFPLIFSAYVTSITVSIINAFILRKRIRIEEEGMKKV